MGRSFIAVLLETHVTHSFYAHAYTHQTPVTVVVHTVDGKEKVFFYLDFFQVFAWGGGSARDVDTLCNAIINVRRPRLNDELPHIPPTTQTQDDDESDSVTSDVSDMAY
eukprot:8561923-Ditylum_brightwellii.AAC.1